MKRFETSKVKIGANLGILSVTLVLFIINIIFQLMSQFISDSYSDFLFMGQSVSSMLSSIDAPLCIPYWFYIFVAIIQLWHLIWIFYGLIKGSISLAFPFPIISVAAVGLSFICDTLWIIYFMRFELLHSIIINLSHLVFLLIAIFTCIYKIQCKRCQVVYFFPNSLSLDYYSKYTYNSRSHVALFNG